MKPIVYEFPRAAQRPYPQRLPRRLPGQGPHHPRSPRVRPGHHPGAARAASAGHAEARVRLTLDYYLPDRRRKDWLNIVTATKPYEDALTPQRERDGSTTPGDIIDDSFAVIQPPVVINWRFRKGQPGFRITITPLGDHECADTPTT